MSTRDSGQLVETDKYDKQDVAVQVDRLTKSYGDLKAVDGLDLGISHGEVFGLLGPNGAGKTTAVECIVGLRRPSSGKIRVLGLDPITDRVAFTRLVAVQPQEASMYDNLTVQETARLFASLHDNPRDVKELIGEVGLEGQADTAVRKLSGGQRRRVLLVVAIIGDPVVVVLDEPAAGLDPVSRTHLHKLVASLRDRGTTVLLTTHDMDEATSLCDRVAIVVDGKVTALGEPQRLIEERAETAKISFLMPSGGDISDFAYMEGTNVVTDQVEGSNRRVMIETRFSDRVLTYVAGHSELNAQGIKVEAGSLTDVFLQLANTSEPDGHRFDKDATGQGIQQ